MAPSTASAARTSGCGRTPPGRDNGRVSRCLRSACPCPYPTNAWSLPAVAHHKPLQRRPPVGVILTVGPAERDDRGRPGASPPPGLCLLSLRCPARAFTTTSAPGIKPFGICRKRGWAHVSNDHSLTIGKRFGSTIARNRWASITWSALPQGKPYRLAPLLAIYVLILS